MALDRSFVEKNRASTTRIRELAASLSDDDLKRPVGEHWTVAVALAHIAFWDRRVLGFRLNYWSKSVHSICAMWCVPCTVANIWMRLIVR